MSRLPQAKLDTKPKTAKRTTTSKSSLNQRLAAFMGLLAVATSAEHVTQREEFAQSAFSHLTDGHNDDLIEVLPPFMMRSLLLNLASTGPELDPSESPLDAAKKKKARGKNRFDQALLERQRAKLKETDARKIFNEEPSSEEDIWGLDELHQSEAFQNMSSFEKLTSQNRLQRELMLQKHKKQQAEQDLADDADEVSESEPIPQQTMAEKTRKAMKEAQKERALHGKDSHPSQSDPSQNALPPQRNKDRKKTKRRAQSPQKSKKTQPHKRQRNPVAAEPSIASDSESPVESSVDESLESSSLVSESEDEVQTPKDSDPVEQQKEKSPEKAPENDLTPSDPDNFYKKAMQDQEVKKSDFQEYLRKEKEERKRADDERKEWEAKDLAERKERLEKQWRDTEVMPEELKEIYAEEERIAAEEDQRMKANLTPKSLRERVEEESKRRKDAHLAEMRRQAEEDRARKQREREEETRRKKEENPNYVPPPPLTVPKGKPKPPPGYKLPDKAREFFGKDSPDYGGKEPIKPESQNFKPSSPPQEPPKAKEEPSSEAPEADKKSKKKKKKSKKSQPPVQEPLESIPQEDEKPQEQSQKKKKRPQKLPHEKVQEQEDQPSSEHFRIEPTSKPKSKRPQKETHKSKFQPAKTLEDEPILEESDEQIEEIEPVEPRLTYHTKKGMQEQPKEPEPRKSTQKPKKKSKRRKTGDSKYPDKKSRDETKRPDPAYKAEYEQFEDYDPIFGTQAELVDPHMPIERDTDPYLREFDTIDDPYFDVDHARKPHKGKKKAQADFLDMSEEENELIADDIGLGNEDLAWFEHQIELMEESRHRQSREESEERQAPEVDSEERYFYKQAVDSADEKSSFKEHHLHHDLVSSKSDSSSDSDAAESDESSSEELLEWPELHDHHHPLIEHHHSPHLQHEYPHTHIPAHLDWPVEEHIIVPEMPEEHHHRHTQHQPEPVVHHQHHKVDRAQQKWDEDHFQLHDIYGRKYTPTLNDKEWYLPDSERSEHQPIAEFEEEVENVYHHQIKPHLHHRHRYEAEHHPHQMHHHSPQHHIDETDTFVRDIVDKKKDQETKRSRFVPQPTTKPPQTQYNIPTSHPKNIPPIHKPSTPIASASPKTSQQPQKPKSVVPLQKHYKKPQTPLPLTPQKNGSYGWTRDPQSDDLAHDVISTLGMIGDSPHIYSQDKFHGGIKPAGNQYAPPQNFNPNPHHYRSNAKKGQMANGLEKDWLSGFQDDLREMFGENEELLSEDFEEEQTGLHHLIKPISLLQQEDSFDIADQNQADYMKSQKRLVDNYSKKQKQKKSKKPASKPKKVQEDQEFVQNEDASWMMDYMKKRKALQQKKYLENKEGQLEAHEPEFDYFDSNMPEKDKQKLQKAERKRKRMEREEQERWAEGEEEEQTLFKKKMHEKDSHHGNIKGHQKFDQEILQKRLNQERKKHHEDLAKRMEQDAVKKANGESNDEESSEENEIDKTESESSTSEKESSASTVKVELTEEEESTESEESEEDSSDFEESREDKIPIRSPKKNKKPSQSKPSPASKKKKTPPKKTSPASKTKKAPAKSTKATPEKATKKPSGKQKKQKTKKAPAKTAPLPISEQSLKEFGITFDERGVAHVNPDPSIYKISDYLQEHGTPMPFPKKPVPFRKRGRFTPRNNEPEVNNKYSFWQHQPEDSTETSQQNGQSSNGISYDHHPSYEGEEMVAHIEPYKIESYFVPYDQIDRQLVANQADWWENWLPDHQSKGYDTQLSHANTWEIDHDYESLPVDYDQIVDSGYEGPDNLNHNGSVEKNPIHWGYWPRSSMQEESNEDEESDTFEDYLLQ